MPEGTRDVFISHAGEDKDAIARPLADELRARGRSVWFAEYELLVGDSLSRRIDEGLASSTVGVVILSHDFFRKEWPRRELDALNTRRMAGEANVIVPVWHGVTVDDVRTFSLPLADVVAANAADGSEVLADHVERLLGRIYAHLHTQDRARAQDHGYSSAELRAKAVEDHVRHAESAAPGRSASQPRPPSDKERLEDLQQKWGRQDEMRDFDIALSDDARNQLAAFDKRTRDVVSHLLGRLRSDDLPYFKILPVRPGALGPWLAYRRWRWVIIAQWDPGEPALWPFDGRPSLLIQAIHERSEEPPSSWIDRARDGSSRVRQRMIRHRTS